jgi:hypothetical protein
VLIETEGDAIVYTLRYAKELVVGLPFLSKLCDRLQLMAKSTLITNLKTVVSISVSLELAFDLGIEL